MARKPQQAKLESIYRIIQENPGQRPGFIANLLGMHRSEVTRSLPQLEAKGFLLAEDRQGRLWPFRR